MIRPLLYALTMIFCLGETASAAPISYIASTVGTGSVGGLTFENKVIYLIGTGNTDTASEVQPALFENPLSSLRYEIPGITVGQFTGEFYVFATDTGFGFGRQSSTDIFDTNYPTYKVFDLRSALDPVAGNVYSPRGVFDTTAGNLAVSLSSVSSVYANLLPVATPEPASRLIMLTTLTGIFFTRRKRAGDVA